MPPGPATVSRLPRRHRADGLTWSARIALILVVAALVGVWGWLRNADARALARMDPDLRGELFRRSKADAEALCARPELEHQCRERLEFLLMFPECDQACRALAARHQSRPTR